MGFLSNIRNKVKKQIIDRQPSIGSIRTPDNFVAPTPIIDYLPGRRPQRGGFFGGFGNLGEAIRRLKEQGDMGMLKKRRMPRIDDGRMRAMPIGPGDRLQMPQLNFGMEQMPISLGDRMIGKPQPIPERMPTDPSSYYNPTIFGQPIGDMDFSQMPKVSPEDMMNLQIPTEAPVMPMTQDLPEVSPVGMMPQMRMDDMQDMEPRMMMAGGDEADSDDFPDLSGDGETTFKDVLIGRGVDLKANGGEMMMEETEMMAPGGDDIEASLMEVQGMQPEMQALDQYVQMVIQMIQAGASEAEVIESLRQAGLDDEDIAALFEAVMETMQGGMGQGEIDQELAQLS